jgi:hypothetical protein
MLSFFEGPSSKTRSNLEYDEGSRETRYFSVFANNVNDKIFKTRTTIQIGGLVYKSLKVNLRIDP